MAKRKPSKSSPSRNLIIATVSMFLITLGGSFGTYRLGAASGRQSGCETGINAAIQALLGVEGEKEPIAKFCREALAK